MKKLWINSKVGFKHSTAFCKPENPVAPGDLKLDQQHGIAKLTDVVVTYEL